MTGRWDSRPVELKLSGSVFHGVEVKMANEEAVLTKLQQILDILTAKDAAAIEEIRQSLAGERQRIADKVASESPGATEST